MHQARHVSLRHDSAATDIAGRSHGLVRARRANCANKRDAVVSEQPGRLIGREPATAVLLGQEIGDESPGVLVPDSIQLGYLALLAGPPRTVPDA
jgi:hypothetical protein